MTYPFMVRLNFENTKLMSQFDVGVSVSKKILKISEWLIENIDQNNYGTQ